MIIKKNQQANLPALAVSFALVAFGLIMTFVHDISRAPNYIQAYLTQVKRPERPDFSKYDLLLKTFAKDGRV
ncbi:MAG: hypothetical protein C0508_28515, partial [Cyanobacteria bacterium PR.023]|nr:hypothetical protein [Cyanobacteria bacterium PR.023]